MSFEMPPDEKTALKSEIQKKRNEIIGWRIEILHTTKRLAEEGLSAQSRAELEKNLTEDKEKKHNSEVALEAMLEILVELDKEPRPEPKGPQAPN